MKKTTKLSKLNFSGEGAHVALVGKFQGGGANNWETVVYKAVNDISNELIKKAADVRVELEMEDFLRIFFNMYYDDAEVLAKILGYDEDPDEDDIYESSYWQKEIDNRVSQVTLIKSLKDSENLTKALGQLTASDYVSVLQTQQSIEKCLSSLGDMKTLVQKSKEENNLKPEQIQEAIEKATNALTVELQKATDALAAANAKIAEYEQNAKTSVLKSREEKLLTVASAEETVELLKSLGDLPDASFEVIFKSLQTRANVEKNNNLFREVGVDGSATEVADDGVGGNKTRELLKAKYATKA